MRMKILAIWLLAGLLAGCGTTPAQQKMEAMKANITSATTELWTCVDSVYAKDDAAPVRPYRMVRTGISLEQMTMTNYISDEEKHAIYLIYPDLTKCRMGGLNKIAATNPTFVPIISDVMSKGEGLLTEVIEGKITWGECFKRGKVILEDSKKAATAEGKRLQTELNQEHQQELAQREADRRAAVDALAKFLTVAANVAQAVAQQQAIQQQYQQQYQQQLIQANRPVFTNCNKFGSSWQCISQ